MLSFVLEEYRVKYIRITINLIAVQFCLMLVTD